jgi:tetratricopeptide (TPR) repeat protein
MQLPVAWYAEDAAWGMAPGYDRPDHADFRRAVDGECMFCHNAYPAQSVRPPVFSEQLPAGIDCERCHGTGAEHARLAETGAAAPAVRSAILNPARLPPDRQLEICMQCHLESTSRRLPFSVRRAGRGVFSCDPREPLAAYALFFDRATPADDPFEVNHAAYRLRQSACFRGSRGRLVCTTCHNPHERPHAESYNSVCRDCHPRLDRGHTADANCTSCHMPKRRTQDAVHVIMTDHRISRAPKGDLLRPLAESPENSYQGEVALYYPSRAARAEDELDVAVAQVRDGANLAAGLPRLEHAIHRYRPEAVDYPFELAEAYRKSGQSARAVPLYEEVLRRAPALASAWLGLGRALAGSGQIPRAIGTLESAPPDAPLLNFLGSLRQQMGDLAGGARAFQQALAAGPELPEPYLNLGVTLSSQGRLDAAEDAFRQALRRAPDLAPAHNDLAYLLTSRSRSGEAQYHFEQAIRLDPNYWAAHLNYARLLAATGRREQALEHFRAAARSPDAGPRREALDAIRALSPQPSGSTREPIRRSPNQDP